MNVLKTGSPWITLRAACFIENSMYYYPWITGTQS